MGEILRTIVIVVFGGFLAFFGIKLVIMFGRAIFKPPIRYTQRWISEGRRLRHGQERHHQHHLKRKTRLERQLDKGTPYHLGADGEIVFETAAGSSTTQDRESLDDTR